MGPSAGAVRTVGARAAPLGYAVRPPQLRRAVVAHQRPSHARPPRFGSFRGCAGDLARWVVPRPNDAAQLARPLHARHAVDCRSAARVSSVRGDGDSGVDQPGPSRSTTGAATMEALA